jgi:hypothetical protein
MNDNHMVKWVINAEAFQTNSVNFQKDLYLSLLALPSTKILCNSSLSNDTKQIFGIEDDKIIDSIIEDSNTYLISPASTNFITPVEIKHLLILHALDKNNFDEAINHAKDINADALLSHLLPDEISDEIDSELTQYYSSKFIYLPAIITDTLIAKKTSNKYSLIYDKHVDAMLDITLPILKTAFNDSAKSVDEEMTLIKWNQVKNSQIETIIGDRTILLMGDNFQLSFLCEFFESQNAKAFVATPSLSPFRSIFTNSIDLNKYKIQGINESQRSFFKQLIADFNQKKNINSIGNEYRTHFVPNDIINSIHDQITGNSSSNDNSMLNLVNSIYSPKHCIYSVFSALDTTTNRSYRNRPHWFTNPFMPNVFFSVYRYMNNNTPGDETLISSLQSIFKSIETSLSKVSKTKLPTLCFKASEGLMAELILAKDKTEVASAVEPLVDYANSIKNSQPDEWTASTITSFVFYAATKQLEKSEAIIENTSNSRNEMLPIMAWFYWITGNHDQSREVLTKIDLENLFHHQIPHCSLLLEVGVLLLVHKQYEKSILVFNEFVRLFPNAFTHHTNISLLMSHWLLASIYVSCMDLSTEKINEFIDHPINTRCGSYQFQKDLLSKLDLNLSIPDNIKSQLPLLKIRRLLNSQDSIKK